MRTAICIAAFSFLAGVSLMFMLKGCGKDKVKQVSRAVNIQNDSTKHYRDKYNTEHAVREIIQADRDVIKALYPGKIDSLADRLRLRNKQLKDMAEVLARANGQFTATIDTIYKHDTVSFIPQGKVRTYTWADNYMSIVISADTVRADVEYDIRVPVTLSTYWKRKWFLARKKYFIDGYSENPSVKIENISNIKIN